MSPNFGFNLHFHESMNTWLEIPVHHLTHTSLQSSIQLSTLHSHFIHHTHTKIWGFFLFLSQLPYVPMERRFGFPLLFFFFFILFSICFNAESKCTKGCDLALASYYVWVGFSNLMTLSQTMGSPILQGPQDIVSYNRGQLSTIDYVQTTTRVNVPFPCDCIGGDYLGYVFKYPIQIGDTYVTVASQSYSNLTSASWLQSHNRHWPNGNFTNSGTLDAMVNCYCGDRQVSEEYGLFVIHPLRAEDSLDSIANQTNLDPSLL